MLWLLSGYAIAQGQPPVVSEPCRTTAGTQAEFTQRLQALEEERSRLIETQSRLGPVSPSNPENAEHRELKANLRQNRELSLKALYALECFRTDFFVDPALTRAPADAQRWIELTVYYGTNRKRTDGASPLERYGSEADDLQLGRATVSIPTARQPGSLPLPSLWRFELRPDPNKHFVLKNVTPLSFADARQELAATLVGDAKSALIFVHGFNVAFTDAAIRTAQLAHDLSFRGVPLFFSWPSAGRILSYWRDEEAVQLSEPAFDKLLDEVSALGFVDVYIVAHSLGTRLAANVLRLRAESNRSVTNLREILLAAPDINERLFREQIAPRMASLQGLRRTIYASSGDLALRASKIVHDYRRLGETSGGAPIFSGFETIDASAVTPALRAFGHSYVVDSVKVLGDIHELIVLQYGADQRKLPRMGTPPNVHWILR